MSPDHPTVISKFILGAKEIELDAVARDGETSCVHAISEHVENAGVYTQATPPWCCRRSARTWRRSRRVKRRIATQVAGRSSISGPFNIQFMAKDNDVMVIECNLRASRSFPFASKVCSRSTSSIWRPA